nr:unnamed protein product [Naegleria fowleri]
MTVLPHDYSLPHTKKVNLEKLQPSYVSGTSKEAYNMTKENLKEATRARDHVIMAMSKAKPYQVVVAAIEKYLPYLTGILHATENEQLKSQKELKDKDAVLFEWTSGILGEENKSFMKSKKYFTSRLITFEVIMIVYTYGFALCNLASEKIKQTTNLLDNNSIIEIYQDAALFLRKAWGVFNYLATNGLVNYVSGQDSSHLQQISATSSNGSSPVPSPVNSSYSPIFPTIHTKLSFPKSSFPLLPELDVLCAKGLMEYAQGVGQVIAIHTAIATGKSSGMIARLSVSVYKTFDHAQQSFMTLDTKLKNQNDKSTTTGLENMGSILDTELRLICAQYRILYRGITLYYLALDANQNGKSGISVCYIVNANKQLEEMDVFDEISKSNPFMNETRRIFAESKKLETSKIQQKISSHHQMAFRIHTFSRAAWQFYTEMLQQHPVKTKGLTCGFCTVIGDFFTQDRLRTKFQHLMPENTSDADNNKTSSHSFSRSIKLFLYGTLLLGPSLHYWFRTLDKLLPSSGCHKVIFQQGTRSSLWKNYFNSSRLVWSAKRVLVEQASYSLFVTSMYLFTMGSLDYIWNEETFVQWHRTEYTNYQEMIANKFNDDFQSTHFHVMKYFPISNFVNFLGKI